MPRDSPLDSGVFIRPQRGQVGNEQVVEQIVRQRSFDGTQLVRTPLFVLDGRPFVQHSVQDASSSSHRDQTSKPASGGRPPSLDDDHSPPICLVQHIFGTSFPTLPSQLIVSNQPMMLVN